MMSICSYYRGRISFIELINMPIDYIHTLYYLSWLHRDDQKELKEAEALEDGIETMVTGGQ